MTVALTALAALVLAAPARADDIAAQYRQAVRTHDATLAAHLRTQTRLLARVDPRYAQLAATVAKTRNQFRPWPLADEVARLDAAASGAAGAAGTSGASGGAGTSGASGGAGTSGAAGASADSGAAGASGAAGTSGASGTAGTSGASGAAGTSGASGAAGASAARSRVYERARRDLDAVAARGDVAAGLDAYAVTRGLGSPELDAGLWRMLDALDRGTPPDAGAVRDALTAAQQANGDVTVSHATVVTDAAILVFREGLEAVLILAAITASFVGARRHLRRPVLLGGIAGIGATALTWLVVQLLIDQLGTGGLRLEAITGIVAIAVLLVVTNWFFHRVYWSQWIARFNRRRKSLEKVGFLSGQAVGLAILGLTSVYREGFETVLFIQNLQVSAGTRACLLGSGIGLAATLAVGVLTFALQRKLPYRRMLIATGVLIAIVLAVMVGNTAHVLQGLGWLPATPTRFALPVWANRWLGLFATYEGLALQLAALLAVVGSYVVARELQVNAPRRKRSRAAAAISTEG